jgi:16S rRNA (guanine527-N7)-methyltransferase
VAECFAELLAGSAVERGLIGPREVPRLWDRHLLNCAAVAELIPRGASVVDVGSGAGLPGIVLAIARPDIRVTLVEPLQRRVVWLSETVGELTLGDQVTIERVRAEDAATRRFDVATARAVATLDRLVGWCLPLLRPGGTLFAIKGQSAGEEMAAAEPVLRRMGAAEWRVRTCGIGVLQMPTTVVEIGLGEDVKDVARSRRGRRPPRPVKR